LDTKLTKVKKKGKKKQKERFLTFLVFIQFQTAAQNLMSDAEKICGVSDKISASSALGRATDQAPLKPALAELKVRFRF
jgi:hypothetical protein